MSKHAMSSQKASHVKTIGHKREHTFNKKFGDKNADINYSGASSDCEIKDADFLNELKKSISTGSPFVSLKSSRTIQIHLGNIPELTNRSHWNKTLGKTAKGATTGQHGIPFVDQQKVLKSRSFWNKYLKKGDVLSYLQKDGSYIFFNMDHVIDFIITNCHWRLLSTGRLKGDFYNSEKNKSVQYLTYEYRSEKKLFVIGAHGSSKGFEFIQLLKLNLPWRIERR